MGIYERDYMKADYRPKRSDPPRTAVVTKESSVPLTRGTPRAGHEPRHGSRSLTLVVGLHEASRLSG
jgi:hypothetical protein